MIDDFDLGEPVEEGPAAYLPAMAVESFEKSFRELQVILRCLEPLGSMKVGEVPEEIRLGAKETLVAAGIALEHQRNLLAAAKRLIVAWLDGIVLNGELIDLDDLGQFYVGDNPKLTYDNTRTASMFAASVADEAFAADPETGEIPPPAVITERIVTATAEVLGGMAPGKAWNKTPLRQRGIDPDRFIASKTRTDRSLKEKK